MANTTNFGWETPDDTDLVKDGASAMRTLGNSIDTSMADLKGGTTGQVLKKNSNTDMDFIWSADSAGMTNPMTTTGDTIYSSSGSTPARLGIGTTGQVLTVNGGVPTWATPAGGGKVLQVVTATTAVQASSTSTTYANTGLSATITPSATTSKILVLVNQNGIGKWSGSGSDASTRLQIKLQRGTTDIALMANSAGYNSVANTYNMVGGTGIAYVDSPATTSATTYKTQFACSSGSVGNVFVQFFDEVSTITLLEIGA